MKALQKSFHAILLCTLPIVLVAAGKEGEHTSAELQSISKLRSRVKNDLTQTYMGDNRNLVRFLRARKMDVYKAEEMLRKMLEWRRKNNMENIMSEDFSYWESQYPFWIWTDREGRLAIVSGLGGIDIRKYVVNGKGSQIMRYIYYAFEKTLWDAHYRFNNTGIDRVRGHLLFNMQGYSSRTHGCLGCLPLWIELAQSYENYYPRWSKTFLVINSPRIFQYVIQIMTPFLSEETFGAIRLYSIDRSEWQPEILKIYPPENVSPEFGGTLKLEKYKSKGNGTKSKPT